VIAKLSCNSGLKWADRDITSRSLLEPKGTLQETAQKVELTSSGDPIRKLGVAGVGRLDVESEADCVSGVDAFGTADGRLQGKDVGAGLLVRKN